MKEDMGSIPAQGTKIPHAMSSKKKKKGFNLYKRDQKLNPELRHPYATSPAIIPEQSHPVLWPQSFHFIQHHAPPARVQTPIQMFLLRKKVFFFLISPFSVFLKPKHKVLLKIS